MMRLPAAIASCTCDGAPVGIAAVPLGRILATAPGVVRPLIGAHPPLETGAEVVVPVAAAGVPRLAPPWVYCATSWVTCAISGA